LRLITVTIQRKIDQQKKLILSTFSYHNRHVHRHLLQAGRRKQEIKHCFAKFQELTLNEIRTPPSAPTLCS